MDNDGSERSPNGEASGLIMEQILEALDDHGRRIDELAKESKANGTLLKEVVAMLKEFGTELASLKTRCGRRLESCAAAMTQMRHEIKGDGKDTGG